MGGNEKRREMTNIFKGTKKTDEGERRISDERQEWERSAGK